MKKLPCGEYYLSILVDGDLTHKVKKSYNTVGIDLGIKDFYSDTNGYKCPNNKYLAKSQKKLARIQRQLSRKEKGSSNRNKARIKVARLQKHTANQRLDFLHKKSTEIANQYDVVCEDFFIVHQLRVLGR